MWMDLAYPATRRHCKQDKKAMSQQLVCPTSAWLVACPSSPNVSTEESLFVDPNLGHTKKTTCGRIKWPWASSWQLASRAGQGWPLQSIGGNGHKPPGSTYSELLVHLYFVVCPKVQIHLQDVIVFLRLGTVFGRVVKENSTANPPFKQATSLV